MKLIFFFFLYLEKKLWFLNRNYLHKTFITMYSIPYTRWLTKKPDPLFVLSTTCHVAQSRFNNFSVNLSIQTRFFFLQCQCNQVKVHIFWEGHKNMTKSTNYVLNSKFKKVCRLRHILVAFSEYMNFMKKKELGKYLGKYLGKSCAFK